MSKSNNTKNYTKESFAELFEASLGASTKTKKNRTFTTNDTNHNKQDASLEYRRQRAEKFNDSDNENIDPTSNRSFYHLTSNFEIGGKEPVFFHRGGLQQKAIKQFKLGTVPMDASIDLHGYNANDAMQRLYEFFIEQSRQAVEQALKRRHLLIIHGKGNNAKQNSFALLKSLTCQQLQTNPNVLAYSSAQPKHGGVGAVYVLLKI